MNKRRYFVENTTTEGSFYVVGDESGYASEIVAKGVAKEMRDRFPNNAYGVITRGGRTQQN